MKTQPRPIGSSNGISLSAWRDLLAHVAPDASQTLIEQQPQLLPHFAAYYAHLQQLPRRVRRGLQRQFHRVRRAHHEGRPSLVALMRMPAPYPDTGAHPTRLSRHLKRQWKCSLAGVALMLALGQAPALAATINVGGGCLLVDAITAANTENAIGLCPAGSGADTLALRPGSTHTLTAINNTTYGPNGLPVISSVITIAGNGSTITRASGAPDFRILAVGSTGNLTLRATTISGGVASYGGGVLIQGGALTLTHSTVSRNTAANSGGGVFASSNAVLDIAYSTVSGNSSRVHGGGVSNRLDSTMKITNTTISGNTAAGFGGGVYNNSGRAFLTNSTVTGNRANKGAGLSNVRGPMSLTNSTVTGNRAGEKGGGVYNYRHSSGFFSKVFLTGSLISGNTATSGAEVFQSGDGVVTDNAFNFFGHSGLTNAQALVGFVPSVFSGTATSDGNLPTALAAILDPTLVSNGGLTQTHALVSNSPAIDAVPIGCPPPNTDQREVPRPQDGNSDGAAQCDIGAFERVRPGTVTCDGLPATLIGTSASETINGTPGPDVIQGLGGNDIIKGLASNDVVCGGSGNDRLFGGANDDRLFGEAGTDRLDGELDFDRCDGGPPATGDTATNCEQVSNVP